jgi:hypothetical protein
MSDQASDPTRVRVDGQDAGPVMQEIGAHHFPDTSRVDEKQIAQRLAMAFSTFMLGVTLPSENDYPYETFWVELHPQVRLTREVFCELLGLEPSLDMVWTHRHRGGLRMTQATRLSWRTCCPTSCSAGSRPARSSACAPSASRPEVSGSASRPEVTGSASRPEVTGSASRPEVSGQLSPEPADGIPVGHRSASELGHWSPPCRPPTDVAGSAVPCPPSGRGPGVDAARGICGGHDRPLLVDVVDSAAVTRSAARS